MGTRGPPLKGTGLPEWSRPTLRIVLLVESSRLERQRGRRWNRGRRLLLPRLLPSPWSPSPGASQCPGALAGPRPLAHRLGHISRLASRGLPPTQLPCLGGPLGSVSKCTNDPVILRGPYCPRSACSIRRAGHRSVTLRPPQSRTLPGSPASQTSFLHLSHSVDPHGEIFIPLLSHTCLCII